MPHNDPVPSRKWVTIVVVALCLLALYLATQKG
jgi:hypothetical protein